MDGSSGAPARSWAAPTASWTRSIPTAAGPQLGCAVRVVAERTVRYYITNLPVTVGAARVADLVRGHWRVPSGRGNCLNWVLDDTFQEDRGRLRTGHAARNKATLRRIALNLRTLLRQYFRPKMSMRRLRKMVARNPAQREPIIAL